MSDDTTVQDSPKFVRHRRAVAAVDSVFTDSRRAANCKGFEQLRIQVVPSGGADPTVEVMFWSDGAGRFISAHTALTYAGKGADTPYEIVVPVYGQKVFVAFTTLAAGAADVWVAGFRPAPR